MKPTEKHTETARRIAAEISIPDYAPNVMFIASALADAEREGARRAASALERASETMPCIETPSMNGENLAVCLCLFFDDGNKETEDDTGWSEAARSGYEEVITAIREHYAAAIRALSAHPENG